MSDEPETRRPEHGDEDPHEQERSQEELDRRSRTTGGDAPAAGSVEQREAVARDDDDLFEGDDAAP